VSLTPSIVLHFTDVPIESCIFFLPFLLSTKITSLSQSRPSSLGGGIKRHMTQEDRFSRLVDPLALMLDLKLDQREEGQWRLMSQDNLFKISCERLP
jgi:hypothetical protein